MDLAHALRLFGRIVETGSLSAAARDLGLGQPAASKTLRKLEDHCGARLLDRTARGMRPTPQGTGLYAACGSALRAIDRAVESVRAGAGAISGALTVHCPVCLGERHLHRIAGDFRARHPAVSIDLRLGNQGTDLVRDNVDLAFGHGRPSGQGVVQRKIGVTRRIFVASPGYLERNGPVRTIEDLQNHDLAVTDASLSQRGELELVGEGKGEGAPVAIRVAPAIRTNSVHVLMRTLIEGRAVGTAQVLLVADELAAGRLVRVLPEREIRPSEIYLSFSSARLMSPAVRAFIDFAVPALRACEGVS